MQPPQFTQLQSGLPIYLTAASICFTLWITLVAPVHASAADVPSFVTYSAGRPLDENTASLEERDEGYTPEFTYLDRHLIGRQEVEVEKLTTNVKLSRDITKGITKYFVLEYSQPHVKRLEGEYPQALGASGTDHISGHAVQRRDQHAGIVQGAVEEEVRRELDNRSVNISLSITATTCNQPVPVANAVPKSHPQLVMYVSNSKKNQKPGPHSTEGLVTNTTGVVFDSGYARFDFNTTGDLYIGISAPALDDKEWFGSWSFEIAASNDGPYHGYDDSDPFLFMVDTDSNSAFFVTDDIAISNDTTDIKTWEKQNPFVMYAFEAGERTIISGMEHSYCALMDKFNSNSTKDFSIETSITTKFGDGHLPRSQFNVEGLDRDRLYNGFVVVKETNVTSSLPSVGTVKGGGMVFQPFQWRTKAYDYCQVLFDLEFCDRVAYAVPSSPQFKDNDTALASIYDNKAREYYKNFTNSLAQVACETAGQAQYSLAKNCTSCENDYKDWLCTVLIPRCDDYTAPHDWLQLRRINQLLPNQTVTINGNITLQGSDVSQTVNDTYRERLAYNQSRQAFIDDEIQPGPYKEMKPCDDLCFNIVKSCPANLGFVCPNSPARDLTYGQRDQAGKLLTCNFPGAVIKLNVKAGAAVLSQSLLSALWTAAIVSTWAML